jgi:hypothetical protein
MFARRLVMQLHQNEAVNFIRAVESEIIPLLRKQPGFRDELVLIDPDRSRAESISFWNSQENAETFGKGPYSDIVRVLRKYIKDKLHFEGFQVVSTTLHRQVESPSS